ncbi:hypothetical protein GTY67_19065 [Streptomyces sp. SID8374]|uniref:hypothetical protein n=1 Tax=Streptomyces sp. SID8374 TaxID=2690354 RepID=UPI00136CC450|nr:hypothetical protein [Streptomyces sp. SID8374]MYX15462.1 hypothetical protein [Streptomyces sp. SID8374]
MDFTDQLGRLARAHQLGADLSANVQAWGDSRSCNAQAVIAPDRLSWELRLRVAQPPPLAEWGFRFGEAINHLRSTLDNLVVAIARQSGVEDAVQPRALKFPICDAPKEGAAASVPPDTEVVVAPFKDDAVLLRHRTKGRIKSVQGNYSFTAQVQVVLADAVPSGSRNFWQHSGSARIWS